MGNMATRNWRVRLSSEKNLKEQSWNVEQRKKIKHLSGAPEEDWKSGAADWKDNGGTFLVQYFLF